MTIVIAPLLGYGCMGRPVRITKQTARNRYEIGIFIAHHILSQHRIFKHAYSYNRNIQCIPNLTCKSNLVSWEIAWLSYSGRALSA
ncbi:hypothetical protein D3C85_1744840 [compost metagenome]